MKSWIATIGLAAMLLTATGVNVGRAKEGPRADERPAAESSREELAYAPAEWPEAPDTAGMLRRLVVGTVIVLVLCVGTLWVGQRWLRGTPARSSSGNALRLVETVSLGHRCTVHLLQAGEQQVLVGIDATGLKSLVPLPQSFERAIADVGSPTLEMVENHVDGELSVA